MIEEVLNEKLRLVNDDCINFLKTLPDNSIDAIVTDPPAGIGFMGKEWDTFNKRQWGKAGEEGEGDLKVKKNFRILPRYQNYVRDNFINWLREIAAECLRVIKPGGHALVWALPKTSHWTATAWEDAGWEVRDRIIYCFGSGFPKSLNIGKRVDKLLGNPRTIIGIGKSGKTAIFQKDGGMGNFEISIGNSYWEGWGTALKPAVEDWWLLRKPLEKGLNVAENVLKWGTGGLNIDGCRVGNEIMPQKKRGKAVNTNFMSGGVTPKHQGRFPAHFIHDGSEEVLSLFPISKSVRSKRGGARNDGSTVYNKIPQNIELNYECGYNDYGSSARFFYCAKASRRERELGLDGIRNDHPTVKPIKLMEYLVKLITPPNGVVLDPFMGSGTTGIACVLLGFSFIGVEKDEHYFDIARRRIKYFIDKVGQRLL